MITIIIIFFLLNLIINLFLFFYLSNTIKKIKIQTQLFNIIMSMRFMEIYFEDINASKNEIKVMLLDLIDKEKKKVYPRLSRSFPNLFYGEIEKKVNDYYKKQIL